MRTPETAADEDFAPNREAAAAMKRPPLVLTEELTAFLDSRGLGSGGLRCRTLVGGNSNFVCELRREGLHAVLRRPPRPPLPPRAHDVLREARLLEALAGRARVPRLLAVEPDPATIGAPFYVMEYLDGHVLADRLPAALDDPASCRATGLELVAALAEVHAIDPGVAGIADLSPPGSFLERQLRLFSSLWEHNRTRDLPAVDRIVTRLTATLPRHEERTIVHGDFRLGNAMFASAPPARLISIFDWEMAALGDPLADLGYLAATWVDPEDEPLEIFARSSVMRDERFARRAELVASYEELTGRVAAPTIAWYRVLALFRTIVFMEGNYRRARDGMADDPFLMRAASGVPELAAHTEALANAELGGRPGPSGAGR